MADLSHPAAVATHPPGVVVEIVGTLMGNRGRSCEEHAVCGSMLEEDMVVRLRKVQVLVDGCEETAIACIWVTDGVDRKILYRNTYKSIVPPLSRFIYFRVLIPTQTRYISKKKKVRYGENSFRWI